MHQKFQHPKQPPSLFQCSSNKNSNNNCHVLQLHWLSFSFFSSFGFFDGFLPPKQQVVRLQNLYFCLALFKRNWWKPGEKFLNHWNHWILKIIWKNTSNTVVISARLDAFPAFTGTSAFRSCPGPSDSVHDRKYMSLWLDDDVSVLLFYLQIPRYWMRVQNSYSGCSSMFIHLQYCLTKWWWGGINSKACHIYLETHCIKASCG